MMLGISLVLNQKNTEMQLYKNDKLLSTYIPQWINAGYSIIVGADHGMTKDCYHGGNSLEQRQTALYIIDSRVIGGYHLKQLTTLEFAPLLCYLLGIQLLKKMKSLRRNLIMNTKKNYKFYVLALIPFFIIVLLFEILPLINIVIESFSKRGGGFTIEHFVKIFSTRLYQQSIFNSLWISLFSAIAGIVIAFIATKAMSNASPKIRSAFTSVLNITSNLQEFH